MPYQRPEDDDLLDPNGSGGSGLLAGYGGAQRSGPQPMQATQPKAYTSQGSGPSVTGHVNFDRIYAANEATANRSAQQLGAQTAGQAQKAKTGLGDMKAKFQSQSVAAQGSAPSADDVGRARGTGGPAFKAERSLAAPQGKVGQYLAESQSGATMVHAPDNEANWLDSMKAKAARTYDGPDSLLDVDGAEGLLSDYRRAQDSLTGIKSDAGLESLLAKQNKGPHIEGGNRLDAALTGAAGREDFARLNEQNKGMRGELDSAIQDSAFQGQSSRGLAQANSDAYGMLLGEYMDRNAPKGVPGDNGAGPVAKGNSVGGYGSYQDFKDQLAVGGGIHDVGEDLSLADQFINKLGEAGIYEGKNVAGSFRGVLGDGLDGVAGSLDDQNRYGALQNIESMYGPSAAEWLWSQMNDEVWGGMSGKNAGAIYKTLADLVEAGLASGALARSSSGQVYVVPTEAQAKAKSEKDAAFTKTTDVQNQRTSGESVTSADGKTSREMSPEQNYERAQAYAAGWGEEWDRQFLGGSNKPTNANAQPSGSGQLLYDENGNVIGLT